MFLAIFLGAVRRSSGCDLQCAEPVEYQVRSRHNVSHQDGEEVRGTVVHIRLFEMATPSRIGDMRGQEGELCLARYAGAGRADFQLQACRYKWDTGRFFLCPSNKCCFFYSSLRRTRTCRQPSQTLTRCTSAKWYISASEMGSIAQIAPGCFPHRSST